MSRPKKKPARKPAPRSAKPDRDKVQELVESSVSAAAKDIRTRRIGIMAQDGWLSMLRNPSMAPLESVDARRFAALAFDLAEAFVDERDRREVGS